MSVALCTLRQMWPLTLLFCLLLFKLSVHVLHRPYFFVTCKIKATHPKCFIFTVLPAKSCTVRQIKQMADLNVKESKKILKNS